MIGKPREISEDHYYAGLINNVAENDLIKSLKTSQENTVALIEKIPENKANFKYADGKWTIKQVLKHISDSERVHSYRALTIARKDTTALPPFDEDFFALSDNSNELSLHEIKNEFVAVRESTIQLFKTLNKDVLDFEGTGNNMMVTPRIIGWLISGHNSHHCKIIEERYLSK